MKTLAIALGIMLILGSIALLAFVFLSVRNEEVPQQGTDGVFFPSTGSSAEIPGSQRTYPVRLRNGETVMTKNFIENGKTFADPANPGSYYLAGALPYCLEDGSCPDTGTPAFSILYVESGQSFSVSLNEEPLGESRTKAEAYLAEVLGISEEELCSLSYTVGTTVSVNEAYGSVTNLGFSFCPDALRLP